MTITAEMFNLLKIQIVKFLAKIFKRTKSLIFKFIAIFAKIFKRLKSLIGKLYVAVRNEEQIEEVNSASTCGIDQLIEKWGKTETPDIRTCGRLFCPRITNNKLRQFQDSSWSEQDFFVLDRVVCDNTQILLVKILFLTHFGIAFLKGRWVSASNRILQISFWYKNHTYPPLEIMVKYANEELRLMKEKARSNLDEYRLM